MTLTKPRTTLLYLVLIGIFGCTTESAITPPLTPAQTESELAMWKNSFRRDAGIGVCFSNETDAGPSDYLAAKTAIFYALESTWETASAIEFTLQPDCPPYPGYDWEDGGRSPQPTGFVRINFFPGSGGFCKGPFSEHGGDCNVALGSNGVYQRIAVHEVGHGLGFGHEHQRKTGDTWEWLCPQDTQSWNRAMIVHEQGLNLCFVQPTEPPAPGAWVPATGATCPTGYTLLTQETAQSYAYSLRPEEMDKLTLYDPLSVMNYCNQYLGRAGDNFSLTELDKLGIEILYPYSLNRQIVFSSALFTTPSGTVIRHDTAAETDWQQRGAIEAAFGTGGITWRVDNTPVASSNNKLTLSTVATLGDGVGTHTISGGFTNLFDTHTITATPATLYVINSELHTALLMSVLSY